MLQPKLTKMATNRFLFISIEENDKDELRATLAKHGSINTWFDLLEHAAANGWTIADCNSFALCSNPYLLSDEITYDDHGIMLHCGIVYYYADHQTKCPIDELLEKSYIILRATES